MPSYLSLASGTVCPVHVHGLAVVSKQRPSGRAIKSSESSGGGVGGRSGGGVRPATCKHRLDLGLRKSFISYKLSRTRISRTNSLRKGLRVSYSVGLIEDGNKAEHQTRVDTGGNSPVPGRSLDSPGKRPLLNESRHFLLFGDVQALTLQEARLELVNAVHIRLKVVVAAEHIDR